MNESPSTIHALIELQAQRQPRAVYAVSTQADRRISYAELAQGCRSVAALLRSHGAAPGDTVSVVMPNGLQTLRVLLGAMHGGLCVNPVNLLAQPEQMRYVLGHSDCRVVCVAPEWEERVRGMLEGIDRPIEIIVVDPEAAALPGEAQAPTPVQAAAPAPDAVALLMYTSGTTGVPYDRRAQRFPLLADCRVLEDVVEHPVEALHRLGRGLAGHGNTVPAMEVEALQARFVEAALGRGAGAWLFGGGGGMGG